MTMTSPLVPGARRGDTKLQNRLKLDKSMLTYADLHEEVVNNAKFMHPTPSSSHRKQRARVEATKREEHVKHMSKSPILSDKGMKVKDETLNMDVLDWRSLEDWQYYHSKTPIRSSIHSSPSSMTTSTVFDGSSNRQRRGQSSSPVGRRARRPTLQSYLNLSTVEGHFEFIESSWRTSNKFRDIKGVVPANSLDGHGNALKEFQFFNKRHSQVKLKECDKKISDPDNDRVPSCSRGKISNKLLAQSKDKSRLVSPDKQKNIVLLLPRNGPGNTGVAIPRFSDTIGQKSTEHSHKGIHFEEVYCSDLCSKIPHIPLPQDIDGVEGSQTEQLVSKGANTFKFFPSPPSKIQSVSPKQEKSVVMPKVSTATHSSRRSDMTIGAVSATKVRNISPKRLLGIGLSKKGKLANLGNSAVVPQSGSEAVTAKSGVEGVNSLSRPKSSRGHTPDIISRDRSSPLRRLLDPLLKPKAAKSQSVPQSHHEDTTSSDKVSESFHVEKEPSTAHSSSVNLDLTSLRTTNLDVVHHCEKKGSSTVEAYIKVAVKNDLPLYTFAVDNNSVVLAATVKKFSSRNDDTVWIYTFFRINETKKNAGWLNYGPKNKEYIPNVIAQMKVSNLENLDSGGKHFSDKLISREYVLFAADLRLFDQQLSNVQPNDELAAIVVKPTRMTTASLNESLPNVRSSSDLRNFHDNKLSVRSHKVHSMTVILPGGAHGIPSKGEPSSLIQRWLSGGLCDCGGWDLGCMVKVLGNRCQKSARQFELYSQSQDEVSKCTPFFALSALNSGIFSVKFDSSISLLQAFSISIATIDSRKPSELQEPNGLFAEK